MYEVSEKYREAIRGRSRKFDWYGTITTPAGRVYHFASKDIVKGSGTLTRSCWSWARCMPRSWISRSF